jgi:hypothetical protein
VAEKDFRVRKGLVVDGTSSATSVAVTTGNVVVADGTLGLTNGILLSTVSGSPNVSQISSQPTNGNIKIAPNGTGDIVFDTDNLDVSADSMKISIKDDVSAALDITEGSNSYLKFTTTNSSEQIIFGKNSTFASTTIANLGTVSAATSITSSAFVGPIDGVVGGNTPAAGNFTSLDVGDGNITNVGDINADSISVDSASVGLTIDFTGANSTSSVIKLKHNVADALSVLKFIGATEHNFIKFQTTLDDDQIIFGKNSTFAGTTIANLGTVSAATSITSSAVVTGTLTASGLTDINATMTVDGETISLDATGSLNIDNTNTTNGITIGTGTQDVPVTIGNTTSSTVTIGDELVVGADIRINGNDIKSSTNATAITLSGSDVEVAGDLTVTGNDIKSNGGTTAITLSGADVTIAGDLNITGDVNSVSVTNLDVDDLTVTLAKGAADSAAANGAGIVIDGASQSIKYIHSGTKFLASTALDVTGTITGDTSLTLDSTTITTAEISVLDGISLDAGNTPDGAVTADKVLAVDANKDLNDSTNHLRDVRMRNLTSTGTITSTQLSSDYGDIKTVQVASGVINAGASTTVATIDSTAHRAAEVLTMVYNTTENTTDLFKTVIMWDGHDTTLNDAGAAVHYTNYAVLSSGDVASGDIAVSKDSANILVKFVAESGIGNDTYVIRAQLILLDI